MRKQETLLFFQEFNYSSEIITMMLSGLVSTIIFAILGNNILK